MTGTSTQTRAGHAGLVLPPLFITMVFCFGLVFLQQHKAETKAAAAQQIQNENKAHDPVSASSVEELEPLNPVTVTPPSTATAATAATATPPVSAPPQPSKTSGSAVQSAAPSSAKNITYQVAKPVNKTLNNLLPH